MRTYKTSFSIALIITLLSCRSNVSVETRKQIDLGGLWQMQLDPSNLGMNEKWYNRELETVVKLPGSLDENKKGYLNKDTTEMHLNRVYSYYGPAWYRKEILIPKDWQNKRIELIMERTKVTRVWIDSVYLGTNNNICTKQVYILPENITGKHFITISVDNNIDLVPVAGSHMYEDNTQTNWNGIIGKFQLEASSVQRIRQVKIYPDIENKIANIFVSIQNPENKLREISLTIFPESFNSKNDSKLKSRSQKYKLTSGDTTLLFKLDLGNELQLWSEFNPFLYKINVELKHNNKAIDNKTEIFGMRKFSQNGSQFVINDIITFLRGKHDACVFPLTGYPPTDTAGWNRVFRIAKTYGINHFRFHSWCPPEAAFLSADINGIYLQPELPIWWAFHSYDTLHYNFMIKEGKNIMDNYGNHASFVMFSLGNEIFQNREHLKRMVSFFREYDNRHLFAQGSNNWLSNPEYAEGDDFWVTFRTATERADQSSDVRGSLSFADSKIGDGGILNSRYPSTMLNYSKAIEKSPVPVIGHEIGQYSIYPDYKEMDKYKGILKPWNFEIFKKRLSEKGMLDQADDFFKASGALSVICYREDIEMAIRTPGFGGFQLLDLQDFPGQGTALVGVLDAFMDSKGLITPEEFRNSCSDKVLLLEMSKYCWTIKETFKAEAIFANYSNNTLDNQAFKWEILDSKSNIIHQEEKNISHCVNGKLDSLGKIEFDLKNIPAPVKYTIRISLGNNITNTYPIWIYPVIKIPENPDIYITHDFNKKTINVLKNGGKVLLFPDFKKIKENSVGGQCIPEFWNYGMFKSIAEKYGGRVSKGTMGMLTNPEHPIFNSFPTEFHTNWQWWPILKNSRPIILDNTDNTYRPVIQIIDNINRNHKLGLIFEYTVESGKILICSADLSDLTMFIEAKQLYNSVLQYMQSEDFKPENKISAKQLNRILYK